MDSNWCACVCVCVTCQYTSYTRVTPVRLLPLNWSYLPYILVSYLLWQKLVYVNKTFRKFLAVTTPGSPVRLCEDFRWSWQNTLGGGNGYLCLFPHVTQVPLCLCHAIGIATLVVFMRNCCWQQCFKTKRYRHFLISFRCFLNGGIGKNHQLLEFISYLLTVLWHLGL